MQHLDEGTIHAWLDGALPPESAADVERHVVECRECAALVAEARGMIAGASRIVSSLDVVRGGVIPKAPIAPVKASMWRSLRLTPTRAALAATLMLAVSTLLTLRHDTPDKLVPTPSVAAPAVGPATDAAASNPTLAPPTVAAAPAPSVSEKRAGGASSRQAKSAAPAAPQAREADEFGRRDVAERPRRADSVAPAAQKAAVADARVAGVGAVASRGAASAPAAAPPAATAVVSGDSARRADLPKVFADSAAGLRRLTAARDFASSRRETQLPLNEVVTTSLRIGPTSCYRLLIDSMSRDLPIPERFALERVSEDTTQGVVRVVTAEGRIRGPIVGSHWWRPVSNVLNVRFASGGTTFVLTIRSAADSVVEAARAKAAAAQNAEFSLRTRMVAPVDCRP